MTPKEVPLESKIKEYTQQVLALTRSELTPDTNLEFDFINRTILLHLNLLQHDYNFIVEQYEKIQSLKVPAFQLNYSKVCAMRLAAIVGTAYEALNLFPQAIKVYQTANSLLSPAETRLKGALIWAEKLFYRYGILSTSLTFEDKQVTSTALQGYQNVISLINAYPTGIPLDAASLQRRLSLLNVHFLYLSSQLQEFPNDIGLKQQVQQISKSFKDTLFNSTAPVTTSSSNAPVEQFVAALFKNWQSSVYFHPPLDLVSGAQDVAETKELLKILQQALVKTFHSCAVARYLVFVLSSLGKHDEALSAFETYTAYQERARIQQAKANLTLGEASQSFGDDDKSVVRVFAKAIDVIVLVKKDGDLARDTADKLRSWLNNEDMISPINNKLRKRHDRNISAVSSIISADFIDGFALVWASIGRAYALYASQAHTSQERELVFNLAVSSYESSLSYKPENVEFYFDYALLLAQNSQIKESITVVKKGLLVDKSYILLWHLLALLLVAIDDYEKALQAVDNALDLFSEYANEKHSPGSLMDSEKSSYLQLKMTQVAIYEASEGIEVALDLVPEIFALYGLLYPNTEKAREVHVLENLASPEQDVSDTVSTKSKRFSLSRTLSRTPFRNGTANGAGSRQGHTHHRHDSIPPVPRLSTSSRVAPVQAPVMSGKAAKADLMQLWLWAASMYRRGDLIQDAEEALIEAEKIGLSSADIKVEMGLLLKATQQHQAALSEFETALEIDKSSPRAVVGLAQLIYEQSEQFLKKDQAKLSSTSTSLFLNENDRLAAITRAQGLVEMLISSGRGFNCSEGWYLMSLFCEQEGDITGASEALWKCVKLEETRSVRSFSVLEF